MDVSGSGVWIGGMPAAGGVVLIFPEVGRLRQMSRRGVPPG
jgi:hypothetical protein